MPQTEADLATLRPIMEQKYIAVFLKPDSWSDLRRLDFDPNIYVNFTYPTNANPVLAAKTDPALRYSRRLLPGAAEVLYKPAEIARIGGNDADYITRPMWFDSK